MTVVVKPPLSWEAVVCCVDGETTKLVIDVAVSVGSMEEVVMEGDVDVVASICRCSSGSCVSSTLPCVERRRDRPPGRFRKSDSRWETGPRRKPPHRRPPQTVQIAPHACPSMTKAVPFQAPPDRALTNPGTEFPDRCRKVKLFCKERGYWRGKQGVRSSLGARLSATAWPVSTFPAPAGQNELSLPFCPE